MHTPPEELHRRMGTPDWELPYVWETNYLDQEVSHHADYSGSKRCGCCS